MILYIFYTTVVTDYLLIKYPTCIEAIIFDRVTGKTSYPVYPYSFIYQTEEYTGVVPEDRDHNLHIGDTVCVVFYKPNPNINRPLSVYKDGKIKCNCK